MPVRIEINVDEVRRGFSNLLRAKLWMPIVINRVMRKLGSDIVPIIKDEIEPHRYRGILSDSVRSTYNETAQELTIGPNAKRGEYDAGTILELGTKPIKNVPWHKIQAWGLARGLNLKQTRGAWLKIREKGVSAYPFIEKVTRRSDFLAVLENAGGKIGHDMAAEVFKGTGLPVTET